jgi:hypothetical protein
MSMVPAARRVERGFPLFVGPRASMLVSLDGLVTWMLQPRRLRPRQEIEVEPVDAADLDAGLRRYAPEVRAAATELLIAAQADIRLSELLANARTSGAPSAVLEVIALLVLQGFATEDRDNAGVASDAIAGVRLEDPLLCGDDLLVRIGKGAE